MTPIADQPLFWLCSHGHRTLRHHENCDECGEERPAPPLEAEPSDISRPDVSDVAGLSHRSVVFLRLAERYVDAEVATLSEIDPKKWARLFLKSKRLEPP